MALDFFGEGNVQQSVDSNVLLQGDDGSSIDLHAEEFQDGVGTPTSVIYAETITPGPSPIQSYYRGASFIAMNLAPGTYSISAFSSAGITFGADTTGSYAASEPSVDGTAEIVLTALGGPTPTPEPATFTLLSSGFFGFGGWQLWRKRRVA